MCELCLDDNNRLVARVHHREGRAQQAIAVAEQALQFDSSDGT